MISLSKDKNKKNTNSIEHGVYVFFTRSGGEGGGGVNVIAHTWLCGAADMYVCCVYSNFVIKLIGRKFTISRNIIFLVYKYSFVAKSSSFAQLASSELQFAHVQIKAICTKLVKLSLILQMFTYWVSHHALVYWSVLGRHSFQQI